MGKHNGWKCLVKGGKMLRQRSIVKFDFDSLPEEYHNKFPFKKESVYIFFGEIPNMPGHCVVCDFKTGEMFCGYHTGQFIELSEEET
jgi:hypothetical protein